MIGPDLQSLLLPHEQANTLVFFVLQEAHSADSSLFPLTRVIVETIELAFAAKHIGKAQKGGCILQLDPVADLANSQVNQCRFSLLSGSSLHFLQLYKRLELCLTLLFVWSFLFRSICCSPAIRASCFCSAREACKACATAEGGGRAKDWRGLGLLRLIQAPLSKPEALGFICPAAEPSYRVGASS